MPRKTVTIVAIISVIVAVAFIALRSPREPVQHLKKTKILLSELEGALRAYQQDCGTLPSEAVGVAALPENKAGCTGWKGPYFRIGSLADSWGREFFYSVGAGRVTVGSYGADGQRGGEGPNADLELVIESPSGR